MKRLRIMLFLLAPAISMAVLCRPARAADELLGGEIYIGARRAMAGGRWDDAVRDFQTLVTVESPLADYARYWQGVCYLEQSRRSSAVDAFMSVQEHHPDEAVCAHAQLALGDVYASSGTHDLAVKMYRAALAHVPSSIDTTYARFMLAKTLAAAGSTREAYRELRLARSPGRTPPDFFSEMADLMRVSSERQDWVHAAQWLYATGDYSGAVAECERVLASAELPIELRRRATLLRGRSLARDGRSEEAADVLHEAAAEFAGTVSASQAMLNEATARRTMRQTTRFVQIVEKLAETYPNSQAAETGVLTVAKAYDGWGKYETAQQWYGRFADAYSWSWAVSDALYRRAVLAPVNGSDTETAIALFQDVIDRSRSSEHRAAAHYWLGKLHLAAGNTHAMAASFSSAARLKPYSYYGMRARGALAGMFDRGPAVPAGALQPLKKFILLAPQPSIVTPRANLPANTGAAPRAARGRLPDNVRTRERVAVARLLARADFEEADWELEALNARFGQPEAKWALAWVLHDAGAHGRAMRIAETLEARRGAVADQIKLVYPFAFQSEVQAAAARFGVDVLVVESVMREESRFRVEDVSGAGAVGLMQLMPATARWVAQQAKLDSDSAERTDEPAVNIALGTWYIRHLLDRFDGNVVYAVAGYNAGPGNVDKWLRAHGDKTGDIDRFIESIPFEETRGYVKRVLRSYAAYKMLYQRP